MARSTPARVYQLRSHHLACCREMLYETLHVRLGFFMLVNSLDAPALAGRIPPLENDYRPAPRLLYPALELDQFCMA